MNFRSLVDTMFLWGFKVKEAHYEPFCVYLDEMLKKDRMMIVRKDGNLEAIVFYYITDDYSKLYKKSTWEMAEDNPEGHQIYVDKMVCRRWNKGVRAAVKTAFEERFPNVLEAYYHRAPFDRCVKIHRGDGVLCPKI